MRIRLSLYFLALVFSFNVISARQITSDEAKKAGTTFLQNTLAYAKKQVALELTYTSQDKVSNRTINYFYIFHIHDAGFIIVSADDVAWPVLGYANQGRVDYATMPWSVAKWLGGYRSDIQQAIANKTPQAEMCRLAWDKLLNARGNPVNLRAGSVSPLISTKWNQSPNFNAQCPYDNSAGQRTVVGCVATAMAQIIKYHEYPAQGTSFHSYSHSTYGTLSANFANTTYDYASMPNTLSSANTAIATLSYHCGVSVEMNYGVASAGGSGAYVIAAQSPKTHCAEYALEEYFGYKTSLVGIERANYSTSSWISALKTELDASRPVLYAGFGSGGGHCFVLDGYDNSNNFHINWGWGGAYDGYFSIDALNPSGVGTGGGSGGFNSGHQAVIGIEPPTGGGSPGKFDLVLYKDLSLDAGSVGFGQAIGVSTNIYNKGTTSFSGDYGMAVFDKDLNFVDFIETKTGYNLTNGYVYSNDLYFSTTGNIKFLPGTYTVSLYYRPTGGDWSALGNYNGHNNYASLAVVYSNDLELYKAITLSTGNTTMTRNKSVSISLDVANYGLSTITGDIDVSLYDLEGKFVETIERKSTLNLPSGTHYTNGLTFTLPAGVTADAGSYLVAVLYRPTGGSWVLAGSTNYQNPIRVTVQDPPVLPDMFENNDAVNSSYPFSPSYSANSATINSTGSNFHVGTDYDFYKITLPAGYDYSILARVHDANNSGDGNVYTVDAVLSVSSDGSIFSEAYDVNMPSAMLIKNGGVFYVKVSPYFTGNVGTYLLNLQITRTAIPNSISASADVACNIYPVPAQSDIFISAGSVISQWVLFSLDGREVKSETLKNGENKTSVDVSNLPTGNYFIRIITAEGTISRQITIAR